MKPLVWLGNSLDRVRRFPSDAKREIGYQLERVQAGNAPVDWKPMPSVGIGVNELRVHARGAFRVIYVVKFTEAVYVLHAFQKKTQKASRLDVDAAERRYRLLITDRKHS